MFTNSPDFSFLSEQQKSVIQSFEAGKNIFVTGGAGTGKSYLLNFLKKTSLLRYTPLGYIKNIDPALLVRKAPGLNS